MPASFGRVLPFIQALAPTIAPTISPTRTEYDFANHIANTSDYFNRTMSKAFQWKYKGCKKVIEETQRRDWYTEFVWGT
ncbi:MAG: hypothetical protein M3O33_01775 [Cyanobacteriota bacterium]|nr:hypothetical protein [Cyanobacteriota bacterium]